MNRKIISEILTGYWCINRQWADAHLPIVIALLKGSNAISFVDRTGNEGYEQPFIVDPANMQRFEMYKYDWSQDKYVPNPNVPPNSVGIIPFTGPLTYYNGDCGEPGMMKRTSWLVDMLRRDNIGSIVQLMDTPGGISTAATHYVAEMKKSKKPILSLVDHCDASLGLWPTAESDEVYLSHDLAEMGSMGSYCMLVDPTGAYEKEGYKIIEIYAPQSTDKNKDYRDALKGDTTAIEEDLRKHVDVFIKHVSASGGAARGERARANVSKWNTGKMFYADDAVKYGLADGIKNLQQVVSKASWLAKRNK
jgi:protease-4